MALHRLKNGTTLNSQEYKVYQDRNWKFWMFVIGFIFGNVTVYQSIAYLEISHIPKYLKFFSHILVGSAIGVLLSYLRNIVQTLLSLFIAATVLIFIGLLIWNAI